MFCNYFDRNFPTQVPSVEDIVFPKCKPNDCSVGKIATVAKKKKIGSCTVNFILIFLISSCFICICYGGYITNIVPLSLIVVGFRIAPFSIVHMINFLSVSISREMKKCLLCILLFDND